MEKEPKLSPELAEALAKVEETRKARRAALIEGGLIAPVDENWKPERAGAEGNAKFQGPRQTPEE